MNNLHLVSEKDTFVSDSNTNTMKKQEQIIKLIETEITNLKLVNGLQKLELDCKNYVTDISDVVFDLVGIRKNRRTDRLYKVYFDMLRNGQTPLSVYTYLLGHC